MVKAVFFDLYNTLVHFCPAREESQADACREFGIQVEPEAVRRTYPLADDFMVRENARSTIEKRTDEEKRHFWAEYESRLLRAAGVEVSLEMALQVFNSLPRDRQFFLFEDVLPTLAALKARGLVLGLLSNIYRDLNKLCAQLGVAHYLDFALSSQEVGAEKPHPPIFLAALERAQVQPDEAIHVGDQYHSDVVGARGVGIRPLLLDRDDLLNEISDCPRIRGLAQVVDYL